MTFNNSYLKFIIPFIAFWALVGGFVKLDRDAEYAQKHPPVKEKPRTRAQKEKDKYPPAYRDSKMRKAINKNHDTSNIKNLLEEHTLNKPKKDKAYKRFTKGLYGGWDWELFKQLWPRLLITSLWAIFNPFYFLSTYSALSFLKVPLNFLWGGFWLFLKLMQRIGPTTNEMNTFNRLYANIANYMPLFFWMNFLCMLYHLHTYINAPSYLMMILGSKDFTPEQKKDMIRRFYAKKAVSGPNRPSAMRRYGVICSQDPAAEKIENFVNRLLEHLQEQNNEQKPRGWEWGKYIFLVLTLKCLRLGVFYSGLHFTYIALPASLASEDNYKISTYQDGVRLNVDDFYTQDKQDKQKQNIDTSKIGWTIFSLVKAICLHSGLPSSKYQLPNT